MASKRLKKWGRIIAWAATLLLLLLALSAFALQWLFNTGVFDSTIRKTARERLGIDLQFEKLSYEFPATLSAIRPTLQAVAAAADVSPIRCERLVGRIDVSALPALRLTEVEVRGLQLHFELDENFRPASLPGGLGIAYPRSSNAAAQASAQPAPAKAAAIPWDVLPRQVRLKACRLGINMPGALKAEIEADASLQVRGQKDKPVFFVFLDGKGNVCDQALECSLNTSFTPEGLTAPVRFSLTAAGLGHLEGDASLAAGMLSADATLEMDGTPFARIRELAARMGRPLPEVSGLARGRVRIAGAWDAFAGGPGDLSIQANLSLVDANLALASGESATGKCVEFAGNIRLSGTPEAPRIEFNEAKITLTELTIPLTGAPDVCVDRVLLLFHGSAGRNSAVTGGDIDVHLGKNKFLGIFNIQFHPLKLYSFLSGKPAGPAAAPAPPPRLPGQKVCAVTGMEMSLDLWGSQMESLGSGSLVLRVAPDFQQIEEVLAGFDDGDLQACLDLFGPYVPDAIRAWNPSGKFSMGVWVHDLPLSAKQPPAEFRKETSVSLWLRPHKVRVAYDPAADPAASLHLPRIRCLVDGEVAAHIYGDLWGAGPIQCTITPKLDLLETAVEMPDGSAFLFPRAHLTAEVSADLPALSAGDKPEGERIPCKGASTLEISGLEMSAKDSFAAAVSHALLSATVEAELDARDLYASQRFSATRYRAGCNLDLSGAKLKAAGIPAVEIPRSRLTAYVQGPPWLVNSDGEISVEIAGEQLEARFDGSLDEHALCLSPLELHWPKVGRAELRLQADRAAWALSSASLLVKDLELETLAARINASLPLPDVESWQPQGKLSLFAELDGVMPLRSESGPNNQELIPVHFSIKMKDAGVRPRQTFLEGSPLAGMLQASCTGTMDGQGEWDARARRLTSLWLKNLDLEAALSLTRDVQPISARAHARMTPDSFFLEAFHLEIPDAAAIQFSGSGKRSRAGPGMPLLFPAASEEARLASESIGNLELENGQLDLQGVDLATAWKSLAPILPEACKTHLPSGMLSASVQVQSLPIPWTRLPTGLGVHLQLRKANLLPADPNRVEGIENLDFDLDAKLSLPPGESLVDGQVSARLANALVYRDVFLQDFAGRKVELGLRGKFALDGSKLTQGMGFLRLPDEVQVEVEDLEFQRTPELRVSSRVKIPELRNDKTLSDLRSSVGDAWPWLKSFKMTGRTSLEANLTLAPAAGSAQGKLAVSQADLDYGPVQVKGFHLELPFDLAWPAEPATRAPLPYGKLRAENIRIGFVTLENLSLPLKIEGNRAMTQALRAGVADGFLEIAAMETSNLLGPAPRASGQLDLKGVRLEKLLESLQWAGFSGSLDAQMKSLTFEKAGFNLEGNAQFAVFGGEIKISNLSVQKLFTDLAAVTFDLSCREVSLEQVTGLLPGFGKMTGVLEGDFTGFELNLATGQPSRFHASFRTVQRPGVRQIISGEAVKHLAAAWGQEQVVKLFNLAGEHKYEEFGFTSQLRNDMLVFTGVQHGKDYEEILTPPLIARVRISIRLSGREPHISYAQFEENVRTAFRDALQAMKSNVEVKTE